MRFHKRRSRKVTASLDLLPVEILLQIIDHVPHKDLRAMRLFCKRLASVAEIKLFHTLSIAPRKKELHALLDVSQHPVLSQHVKCLFYDLGLYDRNLFEICGKFERFMAAADDILNEGSSLRQVIAGWKYSKNILNDEEWIVNSKVVGKVLSRVLPRLPSFSQLEFGSYSLGEAHAITRTVWHMGSMFFRSDINTAKRAIRTTFKALRKAKVHLKALKLHPLPDVMFNQNEIFPSYADHLPRTNRRVFSMLKSIDLCFPHCAIEQTLDLFTIGPSGQPPVSINSHTDPIAIAEMLQSAKDLRHLSFGYNELSGCEKQGIREWSHYPLKLLFGDGVKWPRLETLQLKNMLLYQKELVEFLGLHVTTLKKVMLIDIILLPAGQDHWEAVTEHLSLHSLTDVQIVSPMMLSHDGELKYHRA
jgi:hypothetical protein